MWEGIEGKSLFTALVQGQDHAGHTEEMKYNKDVQVFPMASRETIIFIYSLDICIANNAHIFHCTFYNCSLYQKEIKEVVHIIVIISERFSFSSPAIRENQNRHSLAKNGCCRFLLL